MQQDAFKQMKEGLRSTWMAGDFGQVAKYSAQGAEEFVDRLNIQAGLRVLDVACGTGNLAIPAARKGGEVTGIDIAPNLLEQARARAQEKGLKANFDEGDAEKLPYADGRFDLVMSMFGAMFAPRPELVAAELARVCRRGGTMAMANWTPRGFIGKTFALTSRYIPPPDGVPPPVQWGDETVVRQRLGASMSKIETTPRMLQIEYPFPPREVVQFFRDFFGPTKIAFSRLDSAGQAEYAQATENLWREHNEASGDRTVIRGEYLEVIATRA